MPTLEEQLIAHWNYKIVEHRKAAADHNRAAQIYQDVLDFTEQRIDSVKRMGSQANPEANAK